MPSKPLEALAETGILKREPPVREEIEGLIHSASVRLHDAQKATNSHESRFDLAYNAAHALALAALRSHGYRAEKGGTSSFKRFPTHSALPTRHGGCSTVAIRSATPPNTKESATSTKSSLQA